jgi:hypothetical protein
MFFPINPRFTATIDSPKSVMKYFLKHFYRAEKNITFILPEILILTMAIMKIRGGDLDLVEYDFKTFAPGTIITTLGYDKMKYRLSPVKGTVHVSAPARIHRRSLI